MVDALLMITGLLVIAAVFVDAVMTTLGVSVGAGPLTSVLLGRCWRLLMRLHRKDSTSPLLAAAGPVFVFAALLVWVLVLWAGWTLVFASSDAVVSMSSGEPADAAGLVFFTGFAIITLGTGNYTLTSDVWGTVTALASFTGFFLVTLSIAYLISVLTAVVARRALAMQINALGQSPTEIVRLGWDGERFTDQFQSQLVGLIPVVTVSAEQHLAYPVLHYFHSTTGGLAAPLAVANLDEALLLLSEVVEPAHRPDRSSTAPLRFALERYLSTAANTSWTPDVDLPPGPLLSDLEDAGVPVLGEAALEDALARHSERRATLHQLVTGDGWSWPEP